MLEDMTKIGYFLEAKVAFGALEVKSVRPKDENRSGVLEVVLYGTAVDQNIVEEDQHKTP